MPDWQDPHYQVWVDAVKVEGNKWIGEVRRAKTELVQTMSTASWVTVWRTPEAYAEKSEAIRVAVERVQRGPLGTSN